MHQSGGFLLCVVCLAIVYTTITNVQADKPCEMPAKFKQIGVACMNSGAKGKKEIMVCAFKKMDVVDENNNFNIVKAFLLGSEIKMSNEALMEKAIAGSLNCYDQFGKVPGSGEQAVECVMAVFKEVCNV